MNTAGVHCVVANSALQDRHFNVIPQVVFGIEIAEFVRGNR